MTKKTTARKKTRPLWVGKFTTGAKDQLIGRRGPPLDDSKNKKKFAVQ